MREAGGRGGLGWDQPLALKTSKQKERGLFVLSDRTLGWPSRLGSCPGMSLAAVTCDDDGSR